VLQRDLAEFIPSLSGLTLDETVDRTPAPLKVLDAGGGQGQLAVEVARLGHDVQLCDISGEMLSLARERAAEAGVSGITFIHDSIQQVCRQNPASYDLAMCHAVLEWVEDPCSMLDLLVASLKPGAYLSLTFYNVDSIKMKNLLRGNYRKVLAGEYTGYRGSLTPTYPRHRDQVLNWMSPHDVQLLCHSGIRCFHDYLLDPSLRNANSDQQLALELSLSRQEPFRGLARYVHLLYRKPTSK